MNDTCYATFRSGTVWFDASDRGKIRVLGEDRVRLLHAMTTNNVSECKPLQGCYAFFLNAQGRILSDVHLFVLNDSILLDTEPSTRERVMQHLDQYIIADDVSIEDVTDQFAASSIEGHAVEETMQKLGAPMPAHDYGVAEWGDRLVARVSQTGANGFLIYVPVAGKQALIEQLVSAGVFECNDPDVINLVRLEHHRPKYGVDFADSYIPQETQLMHAIHFAKGCYLGQEIVERVRSRGHLNKMLVPFEIESDHAYPPNTKVHSDGAEAGYLTSSAYSPRLGKVVALGQLRTTAFGKELNVEGARAIAVNLPAPAAKC